MTTQATPPSPGNGSLRDRVLSGTLWMFAMRWLVRLLSIFSIVLLARLLSKEDFGLAAMAGTVVALPTVLLELGMEHAIIREHRPERGHYNTAWTIRVIQFGFIAIAIYLVAPWAADFYNDARIVDILEVLAIAIFIRGLENFWTVAFRKDMDFHRDFIYEVACKLFGALAGIYLAYTLRTYWALIYGQLAAHSFRLVLSLVMAPHLPRPALSHVRLIWSFSQWSLVNGLARYVVLNADKLILGRLASVETVGAYSLGREIASMPLSEITGPANRAFGPGFAEMQHEPNRLAWALGKALGSLATICFPVAIGIALTAPELVTVALGPGWEATVPILSILAVGSVPLTLRGTVANAHVILGHIKRTTIVAWARAITYLVAAIPMTIHWGAEGLALAFAGTEVIASLILYRLSLQLLPAFTARLMLRAVSRPTLAVAFMALLVVATRGLGIADPLLSLVCQAAVGAVSYSAAIYLLWRRAGRPDGLEAMALQRLAALRGKR